MRTRKRGRRQYLLNAELSYCVVHQDSHILYRHTDIPIGPAALVWPILGTLTLEINKHTLHLRLPLADAKGLKGRDHKADTKTPRKPYGLFSHLSQL
jgi:hypothetical protein